MPDLNAMQQMAKAVCVFFSGAFAYVSVEENKETMKADLTLC